MATKLTIGVMFGTVAVALGGGAYYFFGVHQPNERRAAARGEIDAWETRWAAARACLLGKTPKSSKYGEALAARDLTPDPWERGTCTRLIGELSRADGEDTRIGEVERAWFDLDRAAGAVADGFIAHVDPGGESPKAKDKPDPLPAALEALDGARRALRAAAGMDSPPATGESFRAAQIIALRDGNDPITSLGEWTMPSRSSVIAFGRTSHREVQMTLAPGVAPVFAVVPPGGLRSVSDPGWGAAATADQVEVGAMDATGEIAAPAALRITGRPRVFAAIGSAADGLVVAGGDTLVFARSVAGKLSADKPLDIEHLAFATDPSGRALIAWNAAGVLRATIAHGAARSKIVELAGTATVACLTADRGWVGGGDQFVEFDDHGAVPHVLPDHGLLGCTETAALLYKSRAAHYVVCSKTCRIAKLEGMRPSLQGAIVGDHVVGIAARGNVLGVFRETGPPTFFATPAPIDPVLTSSDGKVIDVLANTSAGVVIVRVPVN